MKRVTITLVKYVTVLTVICAVLLCACACTADRAVGEDEGSSPSTTVSSTTTTTTGGQSSDGTTTTTSHGDLEDELDFNETEFLPSVNTTTTTSTSADPEIGETTTTTTTTRVVTTVPSIDDEGYGPIVKP